MIDSEFPQRPCELVWAAGSAAAAVYAFEAGDHVGDLHPLAKPADSLGVSVAAAHEADAEDSIAFGFYVDTFRADGRARGKGTPAYGAFADI